jgi:hypothetical protein
MMLLGFLLMLALFSLPLLLIGAVAALMVWAVRGGKRT